MISLQVPVLSYTNILNACDVDTADHSFNFATDRHNIKDSIVADQIDDLWANLGFNDRKLGFLVTLWS